MNELRDHSLAKAYGQAVFDLAVEADALETSFEQIDFVDKVLAENTEFGNFLIAPFVPVKEKIKLVNKTFEDKLSETILNFLCVLIKNNRTAIFHNIKKYFEEKFDQSRGYLHASVTLDRQLDQAGEMELRKKLEDVTGKKIKMQKMIDPSILGGVIIKCNGKVVDNSVKGALERAVKHIKAIK